MKILHYTHNLGSGGAEKLLTDILPLMKEKGHEIHLAYSNSAKNVSKFQENIEDAKISVIDFNTSFYNPLQIYKLIRLLRKEQYDIVHAHLFPTQYWLAFASYFKPKQTKLVKTEHNVYNNRRGYRLLLSLEKIIYNRYSKIIAITQEVALELKNWLGHHASIEVIPNGINLMQMEKAKANNVEYEFLNSANFNILMVGRFVGKAKDQNTLIKALKLLPDNFQLFFIGEGILMNNSKELAEALGVQTRVHFLGRRSDVYSLMNKISLNVLSTKYEGLSGVTLESLASGKPFIGSDVPGINNIVPDNRFLFVKQNPEKLAGKIKEISSDDLLAKDMANTALFFVKQFDINVMVDKYLLVYQKCVVTHRN